MADLVEELRCVIVDLTTQVGDARAERDAARDEAATMRDALVEACDVIHAFADEGMAARLRALAGEGK